MENNNSKGRSFNYLWLELQGILKHYYLLSYLTVRSNAEYGKKDDFDNYIRRSKTIVDNATRDNATETDDEMLTEHLKLVGINKFRYSLGEYIYTKSMEKYRCSFEDDRMAVVIRDKCDKITAYKEFKYEDHPKEFFYIIVKDLSINNTKSVFFIKNKYNVSIANTVLKFFIKDLKLLKNTVENTAGCYITGSNCDDKVVLFKSFMEKTNLKFSEALVKTIIEIANYEMAQHFLLEFGGQKKDMLKSALLNGDIDVIRIFLDEELKDCENIIPFLNIALTNNTSIAVDLVQCLFNNYYDWKQENSIRNLIESFKYITDPRLAKVVFNELLSNGCDIYDTTNNVYCQQLIYAVAKSGSIEVMQYILGKISEKLTNEQIATIIIDKDNRIISRVIIENNTSMFKFLLRVPGVNLDTVIENNEEILYYATENDNTEIVRLLLTNNKIIVNILDEHGMTPLYMAISYGNTEIVRLLLTNDKVDVNIQGERGWTLLHKAVYDRETEIVKLLLTNDEVDMSIQDESGMTPLCMAVSSGKTEIVRVLLTNDKVDVNIPDKQGMTPLCMAVSNRHIEMIRLLLTNDKIDVNIPGEQGMTPLGMVAIGHFDCYYNTMDIEIVRLLLTNDKIDVNIPDKQGMTPLCRAVSVGETEIVRALLTNDKIDVNIPDEHGMTPLCMAISGGETEILTNDKIDVDIPDEQGMTRLHKVVPNRKAKMVKLLLTNDKVDVNIPDKQGMTPLCRAVSVRETEIVRVLLTNDKIDVNIPDERGLTPLHYATINGNIEVIKMLFIKQPNLDINKKDKDGKSPLELAFEHNKAEVAKYLLEEWTNHIKKEIKDVSDRKKEIDKQSQILKDFEIRYSMENIIDYFISQFEEGNNKSKTTKI